MEAVDPTISLVADAAEILSSSRYGVSMGECVRFPGVREPEAESEPLWRDVLGAQIREIRHREGLSLTETARRAAISSQYLSEIERGRKEPSSEIVAAVAGALGSSVLEVASRTVTEMRRLRGDVIRIGRTDFARPTRRPSGPVAMYGLAA